MDTANSPTTAAPAAPGASAPPTPAASPRALLAERRVKMAERARDVLGGSSRAAPSASATAPAAAVAAIEATGARAPVQRENESDQSYELRLSKALRANTALQSENISAKRRVTELEAEWGPVKSLFDAVKADPTRVVELLERAGSSPDQIAQLMLDGKIKRQVRAELPPEVQERMAFLERAAKKLEEKESADAAAEEARQAEATQSATRAADLSTVTGTIDALKTELPLTAMLPGLAGRVLDELYAEHRRNPEANLDVEARLRSVERSLVRDGRALLTNPDALKALCSEPTVRDSVMRALGLSPAREQSPRPGPASDGRAANEDGPRSLSHAATSEVPSRQERAVTKSERRERMKAAARAVLSGA